MKKPKLLWKGNIGGDPNNPFMKHPFVTLSEKGNLTKKQWKVINEFIKKSIEDNKEAIIEGVKRDLETQWFAEKVETPKGKGYKVAKLEGEGYIHIDTVNEIEKKAYQKGKEDKEKELTRNVLLDGEPRNYIGMDTPDGKLSKKYKELLSQQREKGKE